MATIAQVVTRLQCSNQKRGHGEPLHHVEEEAQARGHGTAGRTTPGLQRECSRPPRPHVEGRRRKNTTSVVHDVLGADQRDQHR